MLTFATGEREQLEYEGASGYDENNRIYVIKDYYPTGGSAFTYSYDELDLTDITALPSDNDPTDQGYYFVVEDGEKFVSDIVVFAGYVILVSFDIDSGSADPCAATEGESKLYVFEVAGGRGFFTASGTTPMEKRYEVVGGGLASTPRISLAPDPDDDKMYVKTSKGRVITIDPPPRRGSGSSMIYWKQN